MLESELLARLRRGDDEAYATIFREHYSWLVLAASRLLGERSLAEEVVQDVMLELWRRREELALTGPLRAYLHQSARNRALNHLRHGRIVERTAPMVARESERFATADGRVAEAELQAALREAVASLPTRCRQVFELSRVQGLKYGEIAQLLGVSVKAVEAQMGKALRTLRERLAPWMPKGDQL